MTKKNILIFSYELSVGGSELNAIKLSKFLDHNFYWLSLGSKKNSYFFNTKSIKKFYNFEKAGKSLLPKRYSFVNRYLYLKKIIEEKKINTIYAIGFLPSFIGSIAKLFLKFNLITTRRGADKAYDKKYYLFNIFISLLSNTIETNSLKILKENQKKLFVKNKIKYVENIIPDYVYKKNIKKKNKNKNKKTIGIISNLRPVKNPELQKSIITFYCKNRKNVNFNIIGRDYKNIYKGLSAKFKKKVVWKKFIKNEKIFSFYKSIDLLLITSLFESSPNIITEAFSNNLPVISTPNIGSKNLIKNNYNGVLSNNFETSKMINALDHVLKHQKKFSKNAKNSFMKKYKHQKNLKKIKSYFIVK